MLSNRLWPPGPNFLEQPHYDIRQISFTENIPQSVPKVFCFGQSLGLRIMFVIPSGKLT